MSGRSRNLETLWQRIEALNSGYMAHMHGASQQRNPHASGTELCHRWLQGWFDAKAAKEAWDIPLPLDPITKPLGPGRKSAKETWEKAE